MKYALSLMLGLWALYSFSGCSLMDALRDESAAIDAEAGNDRDREEGDRTEQENYVARKPRSLNGLSANNVPSLEPSVSRGYGRRLSSLADQADNVADEAQAGYRRVTREDFIDKQARENSLWDAQGQGNYLFSNNRRREVGDLVTGEVEKDLKREIQYQLWMTLPPEQRKVKRKPASVPKTGADAAAQVADAAKGSEEKAKDAAAEAAKTNMPESKDDDIVRMEVVESLGNGLVRVVGQKRVIYRGVSRVVEITALANNKDIDDGNRVKSTNFLDLKTQVIQ